MIGESVAHYRVTSKLGAGGMGEVFRATDSRLNREVALKLLPEHLANDKERMARFHREAQVLASLSHPNIAGIHGLEESGTRTALVMELVEGEDLSERLDAVPSRSSRRLASRGRSPRRSKRRTTRASSTATSSPPTSRSRPTAR